MLQVAQGQEDWECNCRKGWFCNHQDGEGKGECEPCSELMFVDECYDGLPKLGKIECNQVCFPGEDPDPRDLAELYNEDIE